jgi:hypothetical protein
MARRYSFPSTLTLFRPSCAALKSLSRATRKMRTRRSRSARITRYLRRERSEQIKFTRPVSVAHPS